MISNTKTTTTTISTSPVTVKFSNNHHKHQIDQQQKLLTKTFQKFNSSSQFTDLQNNSDLASFTNSTDTLRNFKTKKQSNNIESSFDHSFNNISDAQPPSKSSNKTENIFYIKQKYKMYLDWLDENYNNSSKSSFTTHTQQQQQQPHQQHQQYHQNSPNKISNSQILNIKNVNNNFFNNILKPVVTNTSQTISSQSAVDVNNLNWYKFETSMLNQNQVKLQTRSPKNEYFSNITNKVISNRQHQNHNLFDSPTLSQARQLPQIVISAKGKVITSSTKKTRIRKDDDSSNETSALSINNNSSLSINRNSSPDEYFEQHTNVKAVKFDSNLFGDAKTTTDNKRKKTTISTSQFKSSPSTTLHLPLKPILKSTSNNDSIIKRQNYSPLTTASSDDNYVSLDSKNNNNVLLSTKLNTNSAQVKNNFITIQNNTKLPPLIDSIKQKHNCSDDFLAVINDMTNSRLV